MTDKKFELLLQSLSSANREYKQLLSEAEDEIKERYGYYPSNVDNDEWIDAYHVGTRGMSVSEVKKSMKNKKPF